MIAKATVAYALLLVIQLASGRAPQDASWILGGSNRNAYAMQALGSPSSADGATIQLSTANSMFPLSDGSTIVLTTAVEADRTGKTYGEKVDPDERVEAGGAADADSTLNRAVAWLRKSPKCK